MDTPVIESPESIAVPVKTQPQPTRMAAPDRVADKRADALNAKKKKKRAAHRVALRRSHTNG
jgi:hypothetical protein